MDTVLVWTDGEIVEVASSEFGPPVELLPLPAKTYKADIWRRATDAEAEAIDAQINAQPVKLRNLFRDCDHLSHADPYFTALRAGFVSAFGPARADELLAPSV